jgi:hypothetical protein
VKIKSDNRFQQQGVEGAAQTAQAAQTAEAGGVKDKAQEQIDRREQAPISLAQLTGAVSSRRTYAETYSYQYVAPQPNVVQVQSTIQVEDLQRALVDKRVPNLNVQLNGNTVSVDGLQLTFEKTATGIQITGRAVNLTQAQVAAAVKKVASLATTARTLAFIDQNAHLYGVPQVQLMPDGKISVTTVASVRVNPKLASQAQGVLDQHSGNHVMPEVKQPQAKKAGRRTQLVG